VPASVLFASMALVSPHLGVTFGLESMLHGFCIKPTCFRSVLRLLRKSGGWSDDFSGGLKERTLAQLITTSHPSPNGTSLSMHLNPPNLLCVSTGTNRNAHIVSS